MKFLKSFEESIDSHEINSDLIFDIFNEIKDELDLEEIGIDDVIRYTSNPRLDNFVNSCYFSGQTENSNSVIVSIFYKSKISPRSPNALNKNDSNSLLKDEYPDLYKSVDNFIDLVKKTELVDCYWYSTFLYLLSYLHNISS